MTIGLYRALDLVRSDDDPFVDRATKNEVGPGRVVDDEAEIALSYDWWPVAAKWRQQGKQPYRPDVVVRPKAWASKPSAVVGQREWCAGDAARSGVERYRCAVADARWHLTRYVGNAQRACARRDQPAGKGRSRYDRARAGREAQRAGYTLNHSPQSLRLSSVGGWVATRATGQFSSRWGGIEDLIAALTVVLPTGELVETELAPRAAVGPELRELFVGSEGTLGVVTDVTLKMFPITEHRLYETVSFETIEAGLTAVRRIMRLGLRPFLVRLYDRDEARHLMRGEEAPGNILLIGFEGLEEVARAEYSAGVDICRSEGGKVLGPTRRSRGWNAALTFPRWRTCSNNPAASPRP